MTTTPPRHPTRRDWLAGSAGLLGAALMPGCAATTPARSNTDLFSLGIASGTPRRDGMVLWTRLIGDALPEQVEVRWEVALDEGMSGVVASGTEVTDAAWAHSVHAEPAGLEAGRRYWYRFSVEGRHSPVGRTRTLPAADALEPLKLIQASCQRWDHGHYAAWRHAAAEQPDLVLFLGDYIYESVPVEGRVRRHEGTRICQTLDDYRRRHAQYKTDPLLQAAHAAAPWLLIWDDHEVVNDYAGLQGNQPEADFAARRAAAYQAYWEHLPLPKSQHPTGALLPLHQHLDWGRMARLILADGRQYRDPQSCPKAAQYGSNTVRPQDCPALFEPQRSLLGMAQEAWLARSWRHDSRWNLLAQPTLMAPATSPDRHDPAGVTIWTDGWDGYPAARQRLLSDVARQKVPGCIVLGGDVHATYVADLKADFGDPAAPVIATEFCGTSITSESWSQKRTEALLARHPHLRYGRADQRGYLSLRLDADRLEVAVRSVVDPLRADSEVVTAARFQVSAAQAGARRVG